MEKQKSCGKMMVETRERNERHFHQLSYLFLENQFHGILLFELIIKKFFFVKSICLISRVFFGSGWTF